jgi:cytidine deaminase
VRYVNAAPDIAWAQLRSLALEATSRSYAPYSHVTVGAGALCSNGQLISGSNIENASYGLTLCAECSLVSDLIRHGGGRLVAVEGAAPRQLSELLPDAFGPDDLGIRRNQ